MSDFITEKDAVYGWETILARPVTPEEGEYRTAQAETDAAWQAYYRVCDQIEDNPEDSFLKIKLVAAKEAAKLTDDVAADLYAVWMHSDGEFQNLRYLASVS